MPDADRPEVWSRTTFEDSSLPSSVRGGLGAFAFIGRPRMRQQKGPGLCRAGACLPCGVPGAQTYPSPKAWYEQNYYRTLSSLGQQALT